MKFTQAMCHVLGEWVVKVAQLSPTLCDPMDCSPPDSPVLWILQARVLEWVAMPFSRGSSQPRDRVWVSCSFCTESRSLPLSHWGTLTPLEQEKKKTLYPLEEAGPCHPSNKATEHRAELSGNSASMLCEDLNGKEIQMSGYMHVYSWSTLLSSRN